MSKKEEKEEKAGAAGDPDQEFWDAEKITDDEEKDAIRTRARVNRYHDFVRSRSEKEKKGATGNKKWFEKD